MNGSIYILKNHINNKVYIGQTIQNVKVRFKQHLKMSKSNKKQAIYKAIGSIGRDMFYFEILEQNIKSYDELNKAEEYYIKKYNSIAPNGYNLCPGGKNWRRESIVSPEQQIKIVEDYKQGYSSRVIAERYNISKTTVIDYLKKNNCELRPKNNQLPDKTTKITFELMEQYYMNSNIGIKDIAKLLNVNVRTINRAKNKYNMKRI